MDNENDNLPVEFISDGELTQEKPETFAKIIKEVKAFILTEVTEGDKVYYQISKYGNNITKPIETLREAEEILLKFTSN